MRGVWLALLVVLSIPGAQALQISAQADDARLLPGVDRKEVVYTVEVPCSELLPRVGATATGLPVHLSFAMSPYVRVEGPAELVVPLDPCLLGQATSRGQATSNQALVPDAPGLEVLIVHATATVAGDALNGALEASTANAVVGQPLFKVQATAQQKLISMGGDRGLVRLTLSNFGNAKTLLTFEVVEGPAGRIDLPDPIALNAPSAGLGSTAEVQVEFEAPDGGWSQQTVVLAVRPAAFVDDALQGEPIEVRVLFRNTDRIERTVPLPPALPLLAVLVVGLAALRRRA